MIIFLIKMQNTNLSQEEKLIKFQDLLIQYRSLNKCFSKDYSEKIYSTYRLWADNIEKIYVTTGEIQLGNLECCFSILSKHTEKVERVKYDTSWQKHIEKKVKFDN